MALDLRFKNPQGYSPQQMYLWGQDLVTQLRRGIAYNNSASGLTATTVQGAIDELAAMVMPIQLTGADNLNSMTAGPQIRFRWWNNASPPVNAPVAATAAFMQSMSALDQRQTQVVYLRDSNVSYMRTFNGTVWSAWGQTFP